MAKQPQTQTGSEKRGVHCDSEGWAKLSDEIDADPKKFRPLTVVDHLTAHREYLARNLAKGMGVGEIAALLREKNILEVSDATMRKFVKDNNLMPAKAPSAKSSDAAKAAPAASSNKPAAKAA